MARASASRVRARRHHGGGAASVLQTGQGQQRPGAHRRRLHAGGGGAGEDHRGGHRPGPARGGGEGARPHPHARRRCGRSGRRSSRRSSTSSRIVVDGRTRPRGPQRLRPAVPVICQPPLRREPGGARLAQVAVGPGGHRRGAPAAQRPPAGHKIGRALATRSGPAEAAAHRHPAPERAAGAVRAALVPGRADPRPGARLPVPLQRRPEVGAIPEAAAEELRERLGPAVHRTLAPAGAGVRPLHQPPQRGGGLRAVGRRAGPLRRGLRVPAPQRGAAIEPGKKTLLTLVYRKLLASSTLRHRAHAAEARRRACAEAARRGEAARPADAGSSSPTRRRALHRRGRGAGPTSRAARPASGRAARTRPTSCEQLRDAGGVHPGQRQGRGAEARPATALFTVARAHQWPEKAVIFTESRRTQAVPGRPALGHGFKGRISRPLRRRRDAEERRQLVEEFRDRTQILLSTEAGAGGPQPPVLQPGRQLRPAVEPAAHRAAHRPLPPLRPAARRGGAQLPQPAERRRRAAVRAAGAEAPPLRRGLRRLRRDPRRAGDRRRLRAARAGHLPVVPQPEEITRRLRRAPRGAGEPHRRPDDPGPLAADRAVRRRRAAAAPVSRARRPRPRWSGRERPHLRPVVLRQETPTAAR